MPRTQDKRLWLAGGALAAVAIILSGWFLVISPQLASATALKEQSESAQQQNAVLQSKIATLKRQNANVGTLKASLQAALEALPFDSGLPGYTRQLARQATAKKVTLSDITVGSIVSATGTGATPAGTAGASGASLVAIPITVVSTGSFKNQLAFLAAIQVDGPRRALVTSTDIAPGAAADTATPSGTAATEGGGGSIDASSTMTLQLSVFSAPLTDSAKAELEELLNGS